MEISQQELDTLKRESTKLRALENAGVDNWEGYDIALEEINRQEAEDQAQLAVLDEIMEVLSQGVYEPSEHGAGFAFTDEVVYEARKLMLGHK